VRAENARSLALLERDPRYPALLAEARAIITAADRIPYPSFLGDDLVNFWQDEAHVRGLWRRTTLDSFRAAEPHWETLLDIDALAAARQLARFCHGPAGVFAGRGLGRGLSGRRAGFARSRRVPARRRQRQARPDRRAGAARIDRGRRRDARPAAGDGVSQRAGQPRFLPLRGWQLAREPGEVAEKRLDAYRRVQQPRGSRLYRCRRLSRSEHAVAR